VEHTKHGMRVMSSRDGEWKKEGEVRSNRYGIVLEPDEAILFLASSARDFHHMDCQIDGCEVCDGFSTEWWSIYGELRADHKQDLYATLSALGVPVPLPPVAPF
jgi:hypothetical protein